MTEIFATDPSNPWSWSVIFDSTATNQIYEIRDAMFAKDSEAFTYTYGLRAKGTAKQLLLTVQLRPVIPDGELALYFRRFCVMKKVVGQFYAFSHRIDSCLGALFSFWISTLKQGIFLVSWQRPTASERNCSKSKGRVFTVADAIVKISSIKSARLNSKMRRSNL